MKASEGWEMNTGNIPVILASHRTFLFFFNQFKHFEQCTNYKGKNKISITVYFYNITEKTSKSKHGATHDTQQRNKCKIIKKNIIH